MIEEICVNLANLDEKVFAKYAYEKEPLKGKLSFHNYYNDYYLKAVEDGKNVAFNYLNKDISEIAKELGAEIEMLEMQGGDTIYNFALYTEPNHIQIYKQNVEESQEIVDSIIDERYRSINVYNCILAHEVFHMLESKYKDLFIYKPHIKLWELFKYENISKLVSLEEVGAMSFVRSLYNMQISPYVLDVIMCMSRAPLRAKKLYNYFMKTKEELANE